jgi:hypothetical protein
VRRKETNKEHIGASGYRAFLKSSLLFIIEVGIAKKSNTSSSAMPVSPQYQPSDFVNKDIFFDTRAH